MAAGDSKEWDGKPRRELDRLSSQILEEILSVKDTVNIVAAKQIGIETEVRNIKDQTTKTNGRLGVVEVKVASLELTRAENEGEEKAGERAEQRFSTFVFTPTTTLLIALLSGVLVYVFTGHT